jgi:hypothetical protein
VLLNMIHVWRLFCRRRVHILQARKLLLSNGTYIIIDIKIWCGKCFNLTYFYERQTKRIQHRKVKRWATQPTPTSPEVLDHTIPINIRLSKQSFTRLHCISNA